jgi:hypothetical protein
MNTDPNDHLDAFYAPSTVSSTTNESAQTSSSIPQMLPIQSRANASGRLLPLPKLEQDEVKLDHVQVGSLRSLKFSPDSQLLTLHSHAAGSDRERIFGWLTDTGRFLGEVRLINEVSIKSLTKKIILKFYREVQTCYNRSSHATRQ